jgi:hypothetical protein
MVKHLVSRWSKLVKNWQVGKSLGVEEARAVAAWVSLAPPPRAIRAANGRMGGQSSGQSIGQSSG